MKKYRIYAGSGNSNWCLEYQGIHEAEDEEKALEIAWELGVEIVRSSGEYSQDMEIELDDYVGQFGEDPSDEEWQNIENEIIEQWLWADAKEAKEGIEYDEWGDEVEPEDEKQC